MPARANKGKGRAREEDMDLDEPAPTQQEESAEEEAEESANDLLGVDTRTAAQKRGTRIKLREHIEQILDIKSNGANTNIDELTGVLKAQDKIAKKVKTTEEAMLDGQALSHLADIGYQKTRQMRREQTAFDVNEWLDRVKAVINANGGGVGTANDDEDASQGNRSGLWGGGWTELGRIAARHTYRAPALEVMMGPLGIEPKKKPAKDGTQSQRKKASRPSEKERVQPQLMTGEDIDVDKYETTRSVSKLNNILLGVGKTNLFKFIINPDSFGQTVENTFHLAFLIKDGKAAIELDEDDSIDDEAPYVYATEAYTQEERDQAIAAGEDPSKRQVIVEWTMDLWKEAIELYDIQRSVIPTREVEDVSKDMSKKWRA